MHKYSKFRCENWFFVCIIPIVGSLSFYNPEEMKKLYQQEETLLSSIKSLILTHYTGINHSLERKFEQLKQVKPGSKSAEEYVSHPINSLVLLRRLTLEWPLVLSAIEEPFDFEDNMTSLPGVAELQVAISTLVWLQRVYKLDAALLAEGILDGVSAGSAMNAFDCFGMGMYFYKRREFEFSMSWFTQALRKTSRGDFSIANHTVLAHLYLARTFFECRTSCRSATTKGLLTKMLSEFPDKVLSPELSQDFREALALNCSCVVPKTSNEKEPSKSEIINGIIHNYSDLCRGVTKNLTCMKCHYIHYHNPRLLIAPFKLEEIHHDPPIVMLHEVISDREVKDMKTEFFKRKSSCMVRIQDSNNRSDSRICEVAWIEDGRSKSAAILSRRVADMTDLHGTMEDCQVARYGLGGQYLEHYDNIPNFSLSPNNSMGNRLATVMFYMNDVHIGGRTVFPNINVAVSPQKGSAVFWYNIDSRGDTLPAMLHSGCPVVMGEKWVINKWIHEGRQDFLKTCPRNEKFPKQIFYL